MKAFLSDYPIAADPVSSSTWTYLRVDEIERLIRVLELKRWWLAESIGIHKTTLRRWLAGRILKVRSFRAAALARMLEVTLNEISIDDKKQQP